MIWFATIQKCGTSSIRSILKREENKSIARFHEHGYFFNPWSNGEDTKKLWYDYGWKNPILDNKMEKGDKFVAIVRNPFDLFVSYFLHYRQTGWASVNLVHEITSFDDFVSKYVDPNFVWHLPPMKKSMFSFIYDKNDNLMIDEYYKLEKIDEVNTFLKNNNLPELHLENKTENKKDYKTYYNEEQVDTLREIWKKDLEYFNYDFNIS